VDTGIGIPEQHFASMSNKFHQVDGSLSRKHGGTGLGLAICRRLADLMHGSLSFESLENAGSTFRLTLTLEETSRMPTVETAIDFGGIPTRFGGRVLLVEDNPVNRRLALALLEKLGCRVDTAVNGLEAVAKADASSYHLILMDCHMPEMDGLEATREIRSRSTDRPAPVIVAMTANAMEGDRERCVAAGMNDYLAKPFHLRDLIELLDRYLKAVPADTSDTLETVPNIDSVNRAC
jgi:CheY-like chemotaxis protein